jgi:hypothetical protein
MGDQDTRGPEDYPSEQPARPVEDREPVGPYAPTRALGESPITAAARSLNFTGFAEAVRSSRIGDVGKLVEAGMTASAAAAHVLDMAKVRAEADAIRKQARAEGYEAGFEAHARVVRAEREARQLDGVWETETTESVPPMPYDVADRALDYATRLVKPIDGTMLPESVEAAAEQQGRCAELIADRLYRWLWRFTEIDDPIDGLRIETCGSCSQPRERHDPGCLYAPRPPKWGPGPTTVNITMTPGSFLPDEEEFADRVRAAMADRTAEMMRKFGAAAGQEDADLDADLVEDDDGAPLPPEQQPCPECLAGKHGNCPGRIIDETAEASADVDDPIRYRPCPCPGRVAPAGGRGRGDSGHRDQGGG